MKDLNQAATDQNIARTVGHVPKMTPKNRLRVYFRWI